MADAEAVATLSAITGLPAAEAEGFLEMAGGDLGSATALFFSMQEGGGGPVAGPAPRPMRWGLSRRTGTRWSGRRSSPAAGVEQGLAFGEGLTLLQPKNGPCGVLAALHAVVVARALAAGQGAAPDAEVSDAALAGALAAILQQCAGEGEPLRLPAWADAPGKAVTVDEVAAAEAEAALLARLDAFKAPGGCVLLVYAALLCRGADKVRTDVVADMGEPPLIVGPHQICSSELVSLLLRGVATGNVAAHTAMGAAFCDWPPALGVGCLSLAEIETGEPVRPQLAHRRRAPAKMTPVRLRWQVCNALKSPQQPGEHGRL